MFDFVNYLTHHTPSLVCSWHQQYGHHPQLVKIHALIHSIAILIVESNDNQDTLLDLLCNLQKLSNDGFVCMNTVLLVRERGKIRNVGKILQKLSKLRIMLSKFKEQCGIGLE